MNKFLSLLFAAFVLFSFSSCHKDKKDEPAQSKAKRTILIYAVASNNLSSFLRDDKNEMIKAAPQISGIGKDIRVLLYSVASQSATEATLSELLQGSDGQFGFTQIKSYDRNTFSTDPIRMREVFADLREEAPADNYGLVLWSHGTGWVPNFSEHEVPEATPAGMKKSYGLDKYQGVSDYCDIDELASAIPDRMFDFVWFDLCYMMAIEVVYQLRDKCDFIGGYPTEDWSPGMNYDVTLPLLAAPNPDLTGTGKAFFDYYNDQNNAVTVTVMKTAGLDRLAQTAADIYAYGTRPSSNIGLQNYSRLSTGMYDFGQFTKKYLDGSDNSKTLSDAFDAALNDIILYTGCSTKNFNGTENAFSPALYSGFSCHFPGSSTSKAESYYQSLDWAQHTNP